MEICIDANLKNAGGETPHLPFQLLFGMYCAALFWDLDIFILFSWKHFRRLPPDAWSGRKRSLNWLSALVVGCLFPAVSVPPISVLPRHTYHSVSAANKLLHSAINLYWIINAKQFCFTGSSARPFNLSPDSVSSAGVPPHFGHLFLQSCIPLTLGTDSSHFSNKKICSHTLK